MDFHTIPGARVLFYCVTSKRVKMCRINKVTASRVEGKRKKIEDIILETGSCYKGSNSLGVPSYKDGFSPQGH